MEWLDWHCRRYPKQTAQDMVKIVLQSMLGCGHLLADEDAVTRRIEAEEAACAPDPAEPLAEPMGDHVRLNLRRAMAEGIPARWIARLMLLSCKYDVPVSRREVHDVLCSLSPEQTGFSPAELSAAAAPVLDEHWLPGHSAIYHEYYHPAYRVLHRDVMTALNVLVSLAKLPDKPCTMIAIDGCCASGKSTLADQLAYVLDAPVVHMDDFFTPHAQKTPERLSQPGGNADVARFREEFLLPCLADGHAAYRPYDCHADAFAAPVDIPAARYVIVEGTYCLHPDTGRPYDLQVFLRVGEDEQHRRILARNGEDMLKRFISTWIPLEERYFAAFTLPDVLCITPSADLPGLTDEPSSSD